VYGAPLLDRDHILMEIKCGGGNPLWMTHVLSDQKIYNTSFSKYGTAYQTLIFPLQNSTLNPNEKELFTHA
ncbi:MAG: VTC domain-containing protein, partial [Clostridia bacterium]|nr:VTC domain-containing protein [Clostridia bacterium]